jgi:3-oxoacyl-[acyl-carrier-protein] synthase II
MKESRKVVITGLGVVSSLGVGKDEFWPNLIAGKSGISKVELFDTSSFKRHYAGQIKNDKYLDYVPSKIADFTGRASNFGIAAVKNALDDAGLSPKNMKETKVGLLTGATLPEDSAIDDSSRAIMQRKTIPHNLFMGVFSPSVPRNIGKFLKIKGINALIPTACAAGNYTISYGYDLIKSGKADVVIVGGAESLSRIAFQGFQKLYAMAPEACSPFDKNRGGMLLGEGAGILILESFKHAKERDANIYAEVLGYGLSCDAHHITIPNKEGIKKAMIKAANKSKTKLSEIDYINVHGTGTKANDKAESQAINEVFKSNKPPVSSIKSMLGHCMGAASAIEAVACCLSLKNSVIPPTINFKDKDPECDVDCVPNAAREERLSAIVNNGFAFGGNNCCVVLKKH